MEERGGRSGLTNTQEDREVTLTEQVLLHGLGAVQADGALLEDVLQELGSLRQAEHAGEKTEREREGVRGEQKRKLLAARWAQQEGLKTPASSPGQGRRHRRQTCKPAAA